MQIFGPCVNLASCGISSFPFKFPILIKIEIVVFLRVDQYIKAGKDKDLVDPDKNQIYTKRKQRHDLRNSLQNNPQSTPVSVKFPTNGWSCSLQRMPPFNRAEMDAHISQSGKNIDRRSKGHSLPTGLKKATNFLEEEYLKDIETASDSSYFYFKSFCYHSFRKNEPPHKLKIALELITGEVKDASCTCVAGKVGLCNHVLALMLKICKFSLYCCSDSNELNHENDMNPTLACTSSLQIWHRTGRGDKITPQPVMEVLVKKPK